MDRRTEPRCIYCGQRGHQRGQCHVQAQRRSRPDVADQIAALVTWQAVQADIGRLRVDVARAVRAAMQEAR